VVRTRSLAQALVGAGHVRLNRQKLAKSAHEVVQGDVLTVALGARVLVLRVNGFAERRGPASAASLLYELLGMPQSGDATAQKEDARPDGNC
jgi:ribosome-associated heat shock protein Hsp15